MKKRAAVEFKGFRINKSTEFPMVYMPSCKLLFTTSPRRHAQGGRVNGRLLVGLKRCADRADLNPDEFWLHGFRSTMATRCTRAGMEIADVCAQLGHVSSSNTIWKYVQAAKGAERSKTVEMVFPEFLL
jgi:integrase